MCVCVVFEYVSVCTNVCVCVSVSMHVSVKASIFELPSTVFEHWENEVQKNGIAFYMAHVGRVASKTCFETGPGIYHLALIPALYLTNCEHCYKPTKVTTAVYTQPG